MCHHDNEIKENKTMGLLPMMIVARLNERTGRSFGLAEKPDNPDPPKKCKRIFIIQMLDEDGEDYYNIVLPVRWLKGITGGGTVAVILGFLKLLIDAGLL